MLEYYINYNDLDKFLTLLNRKLYQYKYVPVKAWKLINQYYYKLEFFDSRYKKDFEKSADNLGFKSEQQLAMSTDL